MTVMIVEKFDFIKNGDEGAEGVLWSKDVFDGFSVEYRQQLLENKSYVYIQKNFLKKIQKSKLEEYVLSKNAEHVLFVPKWLAIACSTSQFIVSLIEGKYLYLPEKTWAFVRRRSMEYMNFLAENPAFRNVTESLFDLGGMHKVVYLFESEIRTSLSEKKYAAAKFLRCALELA